MTVENQPSTPASPTTPVTAPVSTAAPSASTAPVVAAPTPTPVTTPTVDAVVVAPVSTEAQPAVVEPTKATTILGEAKTSESDNKATEVKPAEGDKPADTKPTDEAKKTEEGKAPEVKPEDNKNEGDQSGEPAPLPTYESFILPEGSTLDAERLGEFTKQLAEFELNTKADHAEVQKFGQGLVDMYLSEVQTSIERLNKHYSDAWEKQKNDWKESFIKDPDIGGNRQETTVNAALEFIRTHGGNEAQRKEFTQLMDTTGIGNHPAMIRLFANAMQTYSEGKPLPASQPMNSAKSKVERRYGKIA